MESDIPMSEQMSEQREQSKLSKQGSERNEHSEVVYGGTNDPSTFCSFPKIDLFYFCLVLPTSCFYGLFLDASSHLYMRVCPSVHRSVGPSVGRLVHPSVRGPKCKF